MYVSTAYCLVFTALLCIVGPALSSSDVSVTTSDGTTEESGVEVVGNEIVSCNLNTDTGNMLCANRGYDTIIQYHNVRQLMMCEYHYCVTFTDDEDVLTCSGYVYKSNAVGSSKLYNPLTPWGSDSDSSTRADGTVVELGTPFNGYNILVDLFENAVHSDFSTEVSNISCFEKYSTCVTFSNGSETCFGPLEITFLNWIQSSLVGVAMMGSIAFFYSFGGICISERLVKNPCAIVVLIPFLVCCCSFLILFVGESVIVQVSSFILFSTYGIALAYLLASPFVSLVGKLRKARMARRMDYESEATSFPLDREQSDNRYQRSTSLDVEQHENTTIELKGVAIGTI